MSARVIGVSAVILLLGLGLVACNRNVGVDPCYRTQARAYRQALRIATQDLARKLPPMIREARKLVASRDYNRIRRAFAALRHRVNGFAPAERRLNRLIARANHACAASPSPTS